MCQFYYKSQHSACSGISLLEALFTLIIIATITLASVAYFRQAEHETQIAALLSEMRGAIEALEQYNDTNGSFAGINATDIVKAHTIIPRYNVVISGLNTEFLINPWTGMSPNPTDPAGITFGEANNGTRVNVTIRQLPSFACETVLEQLNQYLDVPLGPWPDIKSFCINQQNLSNQLGGDAVMTYPKRSAIRN